MCCEKEKKPIENKDKEAKPKGNNNHKFIDVNIPEKYMKKTDK